MLRGIVNTSSVPIVAMGMIGTSALSAFSPFALLGVIGLLPAVVASAVLFCHYAEPPKLLKAQGLTIITQLATGLLLTLGILL